MYCKECGHKIKEGDRFCNQCGSRITYLVDDSPRKRKLRIIAYEAIMAAVVFQVCFLIAFIPFVIFDYINQDFAALIVDIPFKLWLYAIVLFISYYIHKGIKWYKKNKHDHIITFRIR